jgi:hypothetical protein
MSALEQHRETEGAVERMATKANGNRTTMREIKELLLAVHHDSRERDYEILGKLDEHINTMHHMTNDEFEALLQSIKDRDSGEDGDIRRAWRSMKWLAISAGGALVVVLVNMIAKALTG